MVKKAHLQPYLTSYQLKSRYLSTSDRVESRRWHLLWLVSQGWTIQQASQAVGINYDYAKDIVKTYNQLGEKAIVKSVSVLGRLSLEAFDRIEYFDRAEVEVLVSG